MSGGNASKNKARSSKRQEGWEEAGGEFYQELYPGGEQELFENLQRADAAKLATLLPSKQARNTTTVKRVRSQNERRQSTFARTTQSRDIHLSMLPDLSENLSNEERSWEEIMQIKAMPLPMGQKREIKARLQNATKLRLQGLEQLQWRQRKVWHRFKKRFAEILAKLELWQSPMRVIEGKFGTGVVSYFLFLRWLFFLNIALSLFIILFLILPNSLIQDVCDDCGENSTLCCFDNITSNNVVLDLIQGTGWMELSMLFYGVYSEKIYVYNLPNLWETDMYYNMPLAYILIPISWALLSLVAIVKTGAKGFKEKLVENEGQFYLYCNLVFGGWDFCVHNGKSAKIKHKALYNEIKGCLQEERYKEEKQSRTREGTILLHLRRIIINFSVIIILIISGFIIYKTFTFSTETLYRNTEENETLSEIYENSLNQVESILLEFLPYITIVVLNLFVPEIFGYLINYENYKPRHIILITLLRTVLLRLASLAVLLSQIYMQISGLVESDIRSDCWETYVGQQFYKLLLTDFAVQFIMTFLINLPRAFIGRHSNSRCLRSIGTQSFYLPKHVLDIVYIQTIIWMGTFFCPFLPIIGTIFYFLLFYIKKFNCLINCTPSPILYKASKSKSLFMSVLFLGFVISIVPVAYSIAELTPSSNCGPFKGYNTVWDFVIITFNMFPPIIREIVFLIGTSTFAVPAFAISLLLLYYYWAVATANRHMVSVLRNQLVLEGHDKQFLLNRLSAFIRQHQKRCERRNRASFADDDSSIRQGSK
ncbi:PREDICTED: transmembrane channel-like protein 7 [Papilio polytes]|uniref:transmembrane channel-like protein 7 n=1 Tax=Papilio polytes TaxID=76194 RepID=UPI000675E726|nr:PREDICTED: transmembrane channel-like protein 7 [Papilio polytes]